MDEKKKRQLDLDELKRIRKDFLSQTEDHDFQLQQRTQEVIACRELFRGDSVQLQMILEESIQQMQVQRQHIAELRENYLDDLTREIRKIEKTEEDTMWEKKQVVE